MKTFTHTKSGEVYQIKSLNLQAQNWDSVIEKAVEQGSGWKLPSIDELEAIFEQVHQKEPGFFDDAIYWSATEFNDTVAWYFDFKSGMDGTAIKKLAAKVLLVKEVS